MINHIRNKRLNHLLKVELQKNKKVIQSISSTNDVDGFSYV